jgi:hypothetical protein
VYLTKVEPKALNTSHDSPADLESAASAEHSAGTTPRGDQHAEEARNDRTGSAYADGSLSPGTRRYEADAGDAADAACPEETEEEITPEMIEAGMRELELSFSDDGYMDNSGDVVRSIFMAMRRASHRPPRPAKSRQ